MKNQIDEMAKDLCRTDTCEIKKIGIPCNHRCKAHIYATRAIDKGYAKASEVAAEIFGEIDRLLDKHIAKANYTDGTFTLVFKRTLEVDIAELKKKYTEGDNG